MAISSLAGLSMAPGSPGDPTSGPMGMTLAQGGGGSATEGLGQINSGAGTVGSALSRASAALGTGGGQGGMGGGPGGILAKLRDNMGGAGIGPSTVPQPIFKKGGKVSSKGRDWHGFGSSKTGNNNHGF